MTLQPLPPTREVGIRELHDRLSLYIRHVESGGEILVTSRGRRVARLSSIEADPLERLRERGLISDPTRPKRRAAEREKPTPSGPVSDLVR